MHQLGTSFQMHESQIYFHQSVGIAAVQCAGNLFLA